MRDRILDFMKNLKDKGSAISEEKIREGMGITEVEDIIAFQDALNLLEKQHEIYYTKSKKWILFEYCPNFRKGKIDIKNGYAYLINEHLDEFGKKEDDIYIHEKNILKALDDDLVLVEIIKPATKDKKAEGKVIKILERDKKNIVGEIKKVDGRLSFVPLDGKPFKGFIDPKEIDKCVEGEIVCVKISSDFRQAVGVIKEHLGHKDDAGIDVKAECAKYDVFDIFPEDAMAQAEAMPTEVLEKDWEGRRDLTAEEIFTIDGADTKDIDDAISLDVRDGYYYLGVHIADVSYYVPEGSPLDLEAKRRGTSTYPANYVIPMLPHKLSNGICSLNEGVNRCAMSCVMKIDSRGKIISADIFPSIIKSKKKMTYDNVNAIIERNEVPEGYEEFAETLKQMQELAHIIRNERTVRGASDFDVDEIKVVCDENGVPYDIKTRTRGEGERLIEDFMIAANEAVATSIENIEQPGIYRVHANPNEEKVNEFIALCELFGHHIKGDVKNIRPKMFQEMIGQIKFGDPKLEQVFKAKAIRCMAKAVYSDENIGHFGLASRCYTHFTSPIRRYPDTETHRLLRNYFVECNYDMGNLTRIGAMLPELVEHCSKREQASAQAEREVNKMKCAEYMEAHVGEEFQVMVTDVPSYGLYVTLDNGIEGLIPVQSLVDDYYEYVEGLYMLKGKKKGHTYKLGDRLFVKCTKASKELKQIDFELVKDLKLEEEAREEENAKVLKKNDRNKK